MNTSKINLPVWKVLSYGIINLPLSFIGLPIVIFVAPFYASELGLPLGMLGTMLFLARMSDVITDPMIGIGSDHLRTRFGRRKPFIAVGIVMLMLGVYKVFIPAPGVGMLYFFTWVSVLYVGFTMITLPHEAWGGELSPNYHVRTRITGSRTLFGLIGLVLATAVPAVVMGQTGGKMGTALEVLAWMVIVALPLCGAWLLWFVPSATPHEVTVVVPFMKSFRRMYKNGPFVRVLLVLLLAVVGETFRITITVFYARDVIGITNLGSIYLYYFGIGLLAIPFWIWFGNRIGKHRALAIAFIVLSTLSLTMLPLSKGDTLPFIIMFAAKGFCFGALQLLPSAMIADVVDVDSARSGKSPQGLYYATSGAVLKLGMAIGQGLSLNALNLVDYQAAGGSSADAINWLSIFYCVPAATFFLVALPLVWRYPLTAARHKIIRARFDARLVG
ncbi:MAG: MFS transporter [Rhodocyclaceae bacterium]|nr:MFS transporter [Rhodocyclaceae bacterium]